MQYRFDLPWIFEFWCLYYEILVTLLQDFDVQFWDFDVPVLGFWCLCFEYLMSLLWGFDVPALVILYPSKGFLYYFRGFTMFILDSFSFQYLTILKMFLKYLSHYWLLFQDIIFFFMSEYNVTAIIVKSEINVIHDCFEILMSLLWDFYIL